MTADAVLGIYAANAPAMAARYDKSATESLLSGVIDLLPPPPAAVLDVGAGSGRDAAWFAARGHAVTAAEPVEGFRSLISARDPSIRVVDAALPELPGLGGSFALVVVNALWHHLPPPARVTALAGLADLLDTGGLLLVSLRHGPLPPGMPVFALDPQAETARAAEAGLTLIRQHTTPAFGPETAADGISWTWLALCKDPSR
jgi:SAM-dependent methyltransferase